MIKSTRREFLSLVGGTATFAAMGGLAHAQKSKALYVCGYADIQDVIREVWIAPFEKAHGVTVQYTPIAGMELLGKVRAEQANPQHSVMLTDDWAINYAKRFDLVAPLPAADMPSLADVNPSFHLEDGYGVAVLVNMAAIGFNTAVAAPGSWADLWKPDFKRKILVPTINISTSIMLLTVASSLATGKPIAEAQMDLNPGFDYLKQLKPNILNIYSSTANAISLLAQGEALLAAPFFAKNVFRHADKGAPISLTVPKEGAFAGINGAALIKNSPQPDLAAKFIDFGLTADVQSALAQGAIGGSVNRNVKLPEEMASRAPITESQLNSLHRLDWHHFNDQREAVIERWNREIAG